MTTDTAEIDSFNWRKSRQALIDIEQLTVCSKATTNLKKKEKQKQKYHPFWTDLCQSKGSPS